jgi:hypothetical protein
MSRQEYAALAQEAVPMLSDPKLRAVLQELISRFGEAMEVARGDPQLMQEVQVLIAEVRKKRVERERSRGSGEHEHG